MQKLFKKIAVLLTALIAVLGISAFATACTDDSVTYAKSGDEITIIVKDENGNRINGETFGEMYEQPMQVRIQFCSVVPDADGGLGLCQSDPSLVNSNGEAKVSYDVLVQLQHNTENSPAYANKNITGELELHVLYIQDKGYEKDYAKYPLDKIPTTITVTLKLAAGN